MENFVTDRSSFTRRLFIVAVTAIAIVPRMPFDKPWTIGGDLSHRFRQLLLAIATMNIFRNALPWDLSLNVKFTLFGIESIMISFLSLLTPYLLRNYLSQRINFPGSREPGMGLNKWMYAVIVLALSGTLSRIQFGNDWWILKKVADVLVFFPTVNTIRIYNSVSNSGGQYPGRGTVLAQVVMIMEYCALVSSLADVALKTMSIIEIAKWSSTIFAKSIYDGNTYAIWTRIMGHSILLNVLDESTFQQVGGESQSSGSDVGKDDQGFVSSADGIDAAASELMDLKVQTVHID